MRLRYFAAGLAAFVLCGWIPGPQGSGGSSGGAGVSFSADPLLLDDGAGIQTYLSAGAADGYALVGTTDGGVNGFVGAFGFYDGNNSTRHFSINATSGLDLAMDMSVRWSDNAFHSGGSKDLYLRRSAASTLTVDSDGAGGAATLAVDKVSLSSAANATSPFTLSFGSRGMWRDGGSRIALGSGSGSSAVALSTTLGTEGVRLASGNSLVWSDTTNASGGSADTYLVRDSANVLRLDGDGSAGTAAKLAVSGIAPMTSGQTLVLYDEGGDAALTVGTTGTVTAAGDVNYSTDWYTTAGTVTLTDETATTIFTLSVPQGSGAGGTVSLSIYCEDGTDEQIHAEDITWAAVNKAGTITQEIATATTLDADADSTGTLSVTYSITEDTADVISFKVNANTSLTTPTTFRVRFRVGSDTSGVTVP